MPPTERTMTMILNEDIPELRLTKGTRFMGTKRPDHFGHLAVWDEKECTRRYVGGPWHLHHTYFDKLPEPFVVPVQPGF
jgi:hypothetical protein